MPSRTDEPDAKPLVCHVVSGFPAIGKTYLADNSWLLNRYAIVDLDSSEYFKDNNGNRRVTWPDNYVQAVLKAKDDYKFFNVIILVSAHPEVREALHEERIKFLLVFPSRFLKDEYIKRMQDKGLDKALINRFQDKWDTMMNSCYRETHRMMLNSGEYLSNVIHSVIDAMNH